MKKNKRNLLFRNGTTYVPNITEDDNDVIQTYHPECIPYPNYSNRSYKSASAPIAEHSTIPSQQRYNEQETERYYREFDNEAFPPEEPWENWKYKHNASGRMSKYVNERTMDRNSYKIPPKGREGAKRSARNIAFQEKHERFNDYCNLNEEVEYCNDPNLCQEYEPYLLPPKHQSYKIPPNGILVKCNDDHVENMYASSPRSDGDIHNNFAANQPFILTRPPVVNTSNLCNYEILSAQPSVEETFAEKYSDIRTQKRNFPVVQRPRKSISREKCVEQYITVPKQEENYQQVLLPKQPTTNKNFKFYPSNSSQNKSCCMVKVPRKPSVKQNLVENYPDAFAVKECLQCSSRESFPNPSCERIHYPNRNQSQKQVLIFEKDDNASEVQNIILSNAPSNVLCYSFPDSSIRPACQNMSVDDVQNSRLTSENDYMNKIASSKQKNKKNEYKTTYQPISKYEINENESTAQYSVNYIDKFPVDNCYRQKKIDNLTQTNWKSESDDSMNISSDDYEYAEVNNRNPKSTKRDFDKSKNSKLLSRKSKERYNLNQDLYQKTSEFTNTYPNRKTINKGIENDKCDFTGKILDKSSSSSYIERGIQTDAFNVITKGNKLLDDTDRTEQDNVTVNMRLPNSRNRNNSLPVTSKAKEIIKEKEANENNYPHTDSGSEDEDFLFKLSTDARFCNINNTKSANNGYNVIQNMMQDKYREKEKNKKKKLDEKKFEKEYVQCTTRDSCETSKAEIHRRQVNSAAIDKNRNVVHEIKSVGNENYTCEPSSEKFYLKKNNKFVAPSYTDYDLNMPDRNIIRKIEPQKKTPPDKHNFEKKELSPSMQACFERSSVKQSKQKAKEKAEDCKSRFDRRESSKKQVQSLSNIQELPDSIESFKTHKPNCKEQNLKPLFRESDDETEPSPNKTEAGDSEDLEKETQDSNTHMIRESGGKQEYMMKLRSVTRSVYRELNEDIYQKNDNVLQELKKVLKAKGIWQQN